MTTEINLGNLVIPIIKPEKGKDYYTETEKQELISIVTDNVNSVVLPQEQTRQENEATRQSNEETRQSQENTRQSNEVSRQTAESARVEAENLRQSNESSRISAEQARVGTFNTQMQAVDTAIAGIHTSQDAYDQNAQAKTEVFNTNATNKMNAYNENASEKIDEYDQHVHDYETELANKVDKVQGKDLSTNDYDNTEKGKVSANTEARHTHSNKSVLDGTTASYTTEKDQKLDGLENYDDTELREDIEQNTTNIEELKQENEDLKKNQLTNTPEKATSHYLQDSADSRFRKFIPIGRSVQESDPTPENPVPIKNTGDNGSVNEKVQNKNWFSTEYINSHWHTNFTEITKNEFTIETNYTSGGMYAQFIFPIKPNTTYTFSRILEITGSGGKDNGLIYVQSDVGFITSFTTNLAYKTFKTQNNAKNLIVLFYATTSGTIETPISIHFSNVQLEEDSTATSYVPHEEQNISFPIAQGQKFYEGSYPDDDEKVHHKMGEIDLSTLTYTQYATNKYRSNIINNIKIPATQSTIPNMFAEKYRPRMQNGTFENGEIGITQNGEIILCDTTGTPSGIIQYELAEEQTEDFTEEQKTAWKEWKKARTYKNVTHISSEDETPANVDITYVQDTKTYIDNQIEPLKSAIISLGGNV